MMGFKGFHLNVLIPCYVGLNYEKSIYAGKNCHKMYQRVWNENTQIKHCNLKNSCRFMVTDYLNCNNQCPCKSVYKTQSICAICQPKVIPTPVKPAHATLTVTHTIALTAAPER